MILLAYLFNRNYKIYEALGHVIMKRKPIDVPINSVKVSQSIKRVDGLDAYIAQKITAFVGFLEIGLAAVFFIRGLALAYAIGLMIFVFYLPDIKVNEKSKEIENLIINDMPHVILTLRLLLLAGLPTTKAISMLKNEGYFNQLIRMCNTKVIHGESMSKVYGDLSYKYQIQHLTRFTRIMILDEKNGSGDSLNQLEKLCDDIWMYKKSMIVKRSEAASTKLLLPMMMSLIGVLVAVTFPAIVQLFTII